jgi:tagatose-1,6-bisphosphate aldolase
MKKIGITLISSLLLLSCGEEKTSLEQIVDLKCNCLELLNKEKDNVLEVINCSDEVANKAEFAKLDPQKIAEAMEKHCPNAAIPYDEMQQ